MQTQLVTNKSVAGGKYGRGRHAATAGEDSSLTVKQANPTAMQANPTTMQANPTASDLSSNGPSTWNAISTYGECYILFRKKKKKTLK